MGKPTATLSIRAALIISGIWLFVLLGLTILAFLGWLPAHSNGAPVTANEIGDWLAGAMAPLAFLWFYVATSMQRDELELQRKELEETRGVLAKQQEELERAAKESAEQTKIMLWREVFEEHRLRMYYLAVFIWGNREVGFNYKIDEEDRTQPICISINNFNLEQSDTAVDVVMGRLSHTLKNFHKIPMTQKVLANRSYYDALDYISRELKELTQDRRFITNPLIAARINGTNLNSLVDSLDRAVLAIGPNCFQSSRDNR